MRSATSARLFLRSCASSASGATKNGLNVLAGVPEKHAVRTVRIYKPAKVATQQGRGSLTQAWKVQFEKLPGEDRWTNPLMGWTSTGDPLTNVGVAFPSKESAIEYAKRNKYNYQVFDPEPERPVVRPIQSFKRAMTHHWDHTGIPVYEGDDPQNDK